MDTENIVSWIVGFIVAAILLGSCVHNYNVVDQCNKDNGTAVKNYLDLPTCIEKGEH
jgi:hypothetical protein